MMEILELGNCMPNIIEVLSGRSKSSRKFNINTVSKYFPLVPKNETDLRILDVLEPEMSNGPWIAGGAALQWYQGHACQTDIDIWVNHSNKVTQLTKLFEKELAMYIVYETDNAITIRGNIIQGDITASRTVQIIKKMHPKNPKEIIKDFDFTICQLVTDGRNFIAGPNTFKDIKERKLNLINLHPGSILARYAKYLSYGYTPESGVLSKLFDNHAINTLYSDSDAYEF